MDINYNEQMLNYYPEVIKSIREFQVLIETQSLKVEEMHEELTKILSNNYFGDITVNRSKNLFDPSVEPTTLSPTPYFGVDIAELAKTAGANVMLSIKLKDGKELPKCYFGFVFDYYNPTTNKVQPNAMWLLSPTGLNTLYTNGAKIPINYQTVVGVGVYGVKGLTNAQAWEAVIDAFDIQLELGTTATEYEPYYTGSDAEFNIERWEKFLGIVPLPQGKDDLKTWLSYRQDTILARLYHVEKLNTDSISGLVGVFTGGKAVSYFKDGIIHVLIYPPSDNKQYKFENIEQELSKKIPAHLSFQVERAYYTWLETNNNYTTWGDVKSTFTNWEEVLLSVPTMNTR